MARRRGLLLEVIHVEVECLLRRHRTLVILLLLIVAFLEKAEGSSEEKENDDGAGRAGDCGKDSGRAGLDISVAK